MFHLKLKRFRIFFITKIEHINKKEIFIAPSFPDQEILLHFLSRDNFFNLSFFEFIFEKEKQYSFEYIFVFDDMSWHKICARFATASIDISGGSNNKKHLLSPLQSKLSLFLACWQNGANSSMEIVESFHRELTETDKKLFDYTTKSIQDLIIEYVRSNEEYKSKLLADYKNPKIDINEPKIWNDENENKSSTLSISPLSKQNKNGIRKYHTSSCLFNSTSAVTSEPTPAFKKSVIASYLDSIKEIIDETNNLDTEQDNKKYEAQQKLENNWIEIISDKLNDNKFLLNKHPDKVLSSIKSSKETLDVMKENNYLSRKFPTIGERLNNFDYIILTFSICLAFYSRISYNSIALRVGGEILFHMWKKEVRYENNHNFKEFKNSVRMDTVNILKLGDFFMSLLQTYPHDLFYRNIKIDSYYTNEPNFLNINNYYLEDIKKNIIIDPNTFPMIVNPNSWSKDTYGGFLSNKSRELDIITGNESHDHIIENKALIYQTVNYLNSIKFGVNNMLLDYITSEEGKYILEHIKPNDALQRTITLEVAKLYERGPFYLNTHADWRGRIYTQSFFLSYQSGDLSLSLLNFWEGEKVNEEGKFYLYIYGANSHNQNKISKASFKDRIDWVNKNYDKIINLDRELILTAESPFIFTAFCLNMREIHNNPNALIKTPVFLDASCSGIQHLAALMKDLELGANTNLIESTIEEKPGDIYERLLEPINKAINKFGEENIEYSMLSLVKLTRKEVKVPIMTKVYNVTKYGISNQLQSIFKNIDEEIFVDEFYTKPKNEIHNDFLDSFKSNKSKTKFICKGKDGKYIRLSNKEIYKIASIINDQIFVVFPSLNEIYNYFIELAKLAVKLELPMTWITPSGLKITQNYFKRKKKVISISIFGKSKKIVIKENTDKIDKGKQIQSIIPNIIHSLDATHLMNIIQNAINDNFNPVITIHDCFGTLPNYMGSLEYRVKKQFVLLYSDNKFLNDYHTRFIQNLEDNQFVIKETNDKSYVLLENDKFLEIPTIPKLGKLDLEKIIKSKYMIS
uniref:DNA-dependent RNA polymerase n=1 Tax=Moniliophthora perniciosa TaxID=153609 RepID=UPI0000242370|nr:DNA-dependent RNA polymerase [Moniliophthora perniciosa]AAQ74287.1 DNA-dependent RNA polymerase [Moniliophthora perniciosa]